MGKSKDRNKKMYYSDEEAAAKLGVDAAALESLVRDQKLRVFKDGPRNMFRADEVNELAAAGIAAEEEIELTPADTSGASSISLLDSAETPAPPGKEDTVITAEGVSIFDEGEEVETADPLAKTQVTMRMEDQVTADGSGSGSGLLDLTRESDDTSLGEVLDKIEMDSGVAPIIEEAPAVAPAEAAAPAIVELPDAMAGLFSGLVIGSAVAAMVLAAVSLAAMYRSLPAFLEFFAANKLLVLAVFAVILGVGAIAGQVVLKPAGGRGAGA
ncbi:MAG: helix-turn-helix domain-containing protein [Phycisphaerae bacterium]|nr:helix-turn-helix domain-containing protein [Phycisphaerae bacterium]